MNRLKKIMTWMAIVGTVLVTGVFCYMPFRDIIRERNKQIVSLESETINDGNTGENQKAEQGDQPENQEKTETSGQKKGQKKQQALSLPRVLVKVSSEKGELETELWQNEEGICYFFLPGFAKNNPFTISEIEGNGTVIIGTRQLKAGDVISEVSWEEEYALTVFNQKGEVLLSSPLIFMYSSALPVLSITTESESMELIDEKKENEEPGSITLLDEGGACIYEGNAEAIRGRGNSTFGLSKKPYQFKLKEGADLFGFGRSKAWNLLADGYDETKLRNQLALGLAKALGMEYVPQGKTVDLYCNGVYYGVYYLCEKIQAEEERVAITDMEENAAAAYRQPEQESLERITSEDGTRKWTGAGWEEEDLTGGYLIERELPERYAEEISGFVTDQGDAYALKSPKYATENQVNYIADLVQAFQDALEQQDGIHPVTGKHYSDYMDVNSFVQKFLVEEVSRNYDGGVTSSFFYKPNDTVSTKLFAGPVWDYDTAFGNCNLDEIVSNPIGITGLNDHIYGTEVFALLYEKEEFYQAVVSLYEEKALPYLKELLEEGIDRLSEPVRQAVSLDRVRWAELDNRFQYYEEYENDIRYLKYFIEARMNFLNEVWLEGAVYHSVTFTVDGEAWKKIYIRDGETAGREPIPSRYSSLFMGWLSEAEHVPYDEYKPVYEDMTFYAMWQELPVEEVILTP